MESEFFMTFIKLTHGLLKKGLAFRFSISFSISDSIGIKRIRGNDYLAINRTFKKDFTKCFENSLPKSKSNYRLHLFTKTPNSLKERNLLWSDYKHYATIKFLLYITPNGSIGWMYAVYGGRTSDVYIARTLEFLKTFEPYDQAIADRGFKIKTDLTLQQRTLAIPLSANQVISVTNIRIYVQHAFKNIKDCRILKNEMQLLYLAIAGDQSLCWIK